MKIGDLVKYSLEDNHGVGMITHMFHHIEEKDKFLGAVNRTCTVLWADGTSTNHSSRWLIRVEEIK